MSLRLDRVGVRYGRRDAVHETTLELPCAALVGLVGPNGAGKSSLLKAAAGLVPHSGTIAWRSRPLTRMARLERARTIAYLPQSADAHWPITAAELVALGRMPHLGFGEPLRGEDAAAVEWALERCDAAPLAERRVDRLSGGERARVLLARALAVEAPVLLVDEPIQSLDPRHQLNIMRVLREGAERGALVVAVLHDVALAARYCTRIVLMAEGNVVGDGAPDDVLSPAALARWYGVEPYVARHRGEPIVLPWRQID